MYFYYAMLRIINAAFFFHYLISPVFAQAPLLHDPGTTITDEEFNATYTHLVGFEGCGLLLQRDIIQAFWDAAAVLNRNNIRNSQPGDSGIDWKLPAALEYLGAPFSQPLWQTIQNLYSHAATFEPSYVHWPTDFTINARCDDPRNHCLCDPLSDVKAYTLNTGGSNGGGPYINFCPLFFAQPSLATVLTTVPQLPPLDRYNVEKYDNRAETFMHEMFHIDRVSSVPPNLHVVDFWIKPSRDRWVQVYGPYFSKVLARMTTNTGQYVIRDAENLMYFAMVTHYHAVLNGEYPSRPFAEDVPEGTPLLHRPYSIFSFEDNKLQISNESALSLAAQTISPVTATCLAEPATTIDATEALFATIADYPEDYQSSLSSWKSTWDAYWATEEPTSTTASIAILPPTTASPKPACRSPPSGLSSPPQATISAQIDTFCKDSSVAGKLISNEEPYVDLPYQADGVEGLSQFMVSWKPTGCGGWETIDTDTCNEMLNSVLRGCDGSPGNTTSVCVMYSYDITAPGAPNPSIPQEYLSRGTFSCVDVDTSGSLAGSSLAGTCTCSWSRNPTNMESYTKPDGVDNCAAITSAPEGGQIGQPQKRSLRRRRIG